jgi:hypothetical protein
MYVYAGLRKRERGRDSSYDDDDDDEEHRIGPFLPEMRVL